MLSPDWPAGADVSVGDADHAPLLAGARLEAGYTRHTRVLPEIKVKSVLSLKSFYSYFDIFKEQTTNLKIQLTAAGVPRHGRVDAQR